MTRAALDYSTAQVRAVAVAGSVDVSTPVAGFFRFRMHGGAVRGGVRIWFGPPHDPVTGEELDRSWRWQSEMNGDLVDFDRVWPACAREPISEAEYRAYCARTDWARQNAPHSAYADPMKRIDPLSTASPLPF